MKAKISNILRLSLSALAVASIFLMTAPARATFIIDPTPGGEKFFIDEAHHPVPVNNFSGRVGGNNVGPIVNVETVGYVNTGSGYANIVPANGDTLTSLIFTPADQTKYGDFSFRGQLFTPGAVDVTVIDQNGFAFVYEFLIAQANQDFERIGVVSNDGEWIQSVEISTELEDGFKEIKQIDFSFQTNPIPEPSTFILLSAGIIGLTLLRRRMHA